MPKESNTQTNSPAISTISTISAISTILPSNSLLLTVQPEAAAVALHEIQQLDPASRLITSLSPEARLISLPGGYHSLLAALQTQYLIFTRHMFPVHYAGPVTDEAEIKRLIAALLLQQYGGEQLPPPGDALPPQFDDERRPPTNNNAAAAQPFSVQLRVEPRDDALFAQGLALAHAVEGALTARGFYINDKTPVRIVSLFLHGDKANGDTLYMGLSNCNDNRSPWNGGAVRYKKDSGYISRAEFKLLEAFAVFGYTPETGYALDLGAAPGGWTRALLNRGFAVTAVDPAALHERLYECSHERPHERLYEHERPHERPHEHLYERPHARPHEHLYERPHERPHSQPRLFHVRDIAQRFTPANTPYTDNGLFDLIVNDMRMDAAASCRILLDAAAWLHPHGKAIMTIKLTPGQWYQKTKRALALLEQKYRVINARQLFHNRDEVTVYAERY